MATTAPTSNFTFVCGVDRSLGGRSWRWRGGRNQYGDAAAGLGDDILTQLLLARGVTRDDLDRQRDPKLAAFLPDPSIFQDMEVAAERLAQCKRLAALPDKPTLDDFVALGGQYANDGEHDRAVGGVEVGKPCFAR